MPARPRSPLSRLIARRPPRWVYLAIGPLVMFAVWHVAFSLKLVTPKLLPAPLATLETMVLSLLDGTLLFDFAKTLYRTMYAFVLAAILGIPVGIVFGASERVYRSIEFLIDFFRSTPATAMFPLFLLIFGLGDFSKISVAAFAAWLVIVFNVAYGVMNARQTRILAARVMGASQGRIFRDVMFYESLPQTFVGLRTGVSYALVVIIVAEMFIGATDGLGQRIIDSQIVYNLQQMYGTILMSGVLGYGLNLLFLGIEKRLVHWAGR